MAIKASPPYVSEFALWKGRGLFPLLTPPGLGEVQWRWGLEEKPQESF